MPALFRSLVPGQNAGFVFQDEELSMMDNYVFRH